MNAPQSNTQNEMTGFLAFLDDIEDVYETPENDAPPYGVGCAYAERGLPCEPLREYTKLDDIEQFIWGWQDTTRMIEEANDYADWQDEIDWIRWGGAR